jgi:hypothetical protein
MLYRCMRDICANQDDLRTDAGIRSNGPSVFQFRDRTKIVCRGCVLSHSGSSDLKQRDKAFKRLWQEGRDGGDATFRDTLLVGGLTAQRLRRMPGSLTH